MVVGERGSRGRRMIGQETERFRKDRVFFSTKETLFNSKKHRRKSGKLMGWDGKGGKGVLGCGYDGRW